MPVTVRCDAAHHSIGKLNNIAAVPVNMVVRNEAPAFQGASIGDVLRMNLQAGTMVDVDDMDMHVSGMSFTGASDMMIGQMVQIEPPSVLVSGTPPQLNTNHLRLMKTWMRPRLRRKSMPIHSL